MAEPRFEEPVDPDIDPARLLVVMLVSVGGGIGSVARHAVGLFSADVWATLVLNVVGCGLIGVLVVLTTEAWRTHPLIRPFLGTGVLGGFTTFSAFGLDFHVLWSAGDRTQAFGYLVGTLAGCLVATVATIRVTRAFVRSGL